MKFNPPSKVRIEPENKVAAENEVFYAHSSLFQVNHRTELHLAQDKDYGTTKHLNTISSRSRSIAPYKSSAWFLHSTCQSKLG